MAARGRAFACAVALAVGGGSFVVACGDEPAVRDDGGADAPPPFEATTAVDAGAADATLPRDAAVDPEQDASEEPDVGDAYQVILADGSDAASADVALDVGSSSALDAEGEQADAEAGDATWTGDAQDGLDAARDADGSLESAETAADGPADAPTESSTDAVADAPGSCVNIAGDYLLTETESVESACPLANCGYGTHAACGIVSLGTATLPSPGMIHWVTNVPGIIDGFTGSIEANGHFECTSDNLGAQMLWIGDVDATCHVTAKVTLTYGGCEAEISEEGPHR